MLFLNIKTNLLPSLDVAFLGSRFLSAHLLLLRAAKEVAGPGESLSQGDELQTTQPAEQDRRSVGCG